MATSWLCPIMVTEEEMAECNLDWLIAKAALGIRGTIGNQGFTARELLSWVSGCAGGVLRGEAQANIMHPP